MSFNKYRDRVLSKGNDNKSRIIFEKKKGFSDFLKQSPNAYSVKIDGNEYLAVIQDKTFNNEMAEDKFLLTEIDVVSSVGSLVEWDSEYWLITSKENETIKSQQSHKMVKCNNTLTYQHPTTLEIKTIPCVLTDKSSVYSDGLKTGVITLQDDQIAIKVPFHEDIVNFPLQKRFIFDNAVVYELTDVDRLTQKGLLILTMKATQESKTNDRKDLNIADYIEPNVEAEPPELTEVVINGSNEIKLNQTNTYTVESTNSILFWLKDDDGTSDTNLVTVVEQGDNSCKIKAGSSSSNVGKYFRLYASDGVNENYIRVMIKSLF